ncbi:MAG: sporulation protein [bacterium]|nr:sporulation protein [bacterium]
MGFFKKMLSSVGIGSAKVDTVLDKEEYAPGEMIEGVVKIKGGNTEQDIAGLYFSVQSTYEDVRTVSVEDEDGYIEEEERDITKTAVLEKFKISDDFVLSPGDEMEIPISFQLPYTAPLTIGTTKVWISTGLDIKKAIDKGDRDYIKVVPESFVQAFLNSMDELGFDLVEVDCEAVSDSWRSIPFVQEFEFKPLSGPFAERLEELEAIFFPEEDRLQVYMEMDRRAKGIQSILTHIMGEDESCVQFDFEEDDIPDLTERLHDIIDNWS